MIRLCHVLLFIVLTIPQNSVRFTEHNLAKALNRARQTHKLVFVDAYASWCAPCQEMKATTFRDVKIEKYFNSHYINAAIDVEKGDGPKFAAKYAVDSYPTLLLLDEQGHIIKRIEGFSDAAALAKAFNIQ